MAEAQAPEAVVGVIQRPIPANGSPGATGWAWGAGWVCGGGGGACLLAVCLSICPSFPTFFLLLSPLLSILHPVSPAPSHPLASSALLPFPPALGAHSENTTWGWPCLAHMQCHGMAPLPAPGKPRARLPAPARSPPSPWPTGWLTCLEAGLPSPHPPWVPSVRLPFHTQRGLLESRVGGLPVASVRGGMGSSAGLVPLPS